MESKAWRVRHRWINPKLCLGLVCSGIFLALALQKVEWGLTVATLREADWSLVFVGVGVLVATYAIFALRWTVLLSSTAWLPVRDTFSYIMPG